LKAPRFGMAHGPCLPAVPRPVPSALRCFTTRFGMGRGGSTALRARHWFRVCSSFFWLAPSLPPQPALARLVRPGSPRPCARVTSTPRDASSARRPPCRLHGDLPACSSEGAHLGAHFPLRCFQRFLLPTVATEPAGRPTTPPPAGRPRRSSRTERSPPQHPIRP
jgi:hypothetical protein